VAWRGGPKENTFSVPIKRRKTNSNQKTKKGLGKWGGGIDRDERPERHAQFLEHLIISALMMGISLANTKRFEDSKIALLS
jgi:hypothetical protein